MKKTLLQLALFTLALHIVSSSVVYAGGSNPNYNPIDNLGAVGTLLAGKQIRDADGDTKVQVEESADEDVIRFDNAGTETASSTINGWNFITLTSTNKIASNEYCINNASPDCITSWPTSHDAVTLAGTPNYLTLSGQEITMTVLDINDDTDLTASSPLSLSAGGAMSIDTSGTWSGNAGTATALASNGSNCLSGNAPLGVDASGAVESCFDVWTEAENTAAGYFPTASYGTYFYNFFSATNTTALTEGTNLYFTNTRVADYLNTSTTLQTLWNNGQTAYDWGDHSVAGYNLQSYASSTYVWASDWTTIDNYPAACGVGEYVSGLGDTLTCSAPAGGSGDPYAWTPATTYSEAVSATSTPLWIQGNFYTSSTANYLDGITYLANADIAGNITNYWSAGCTNQFMTDISDAGVMSCATVDIGSDTNLAAGRSLTLSGDSVEADSELYTDTKCIWFEDPTADDDFKSIWTTNGFASTITKIWCESDQTVNMDLQIDDGSPADVNGTDLVCDSTPAEDESMGGDATMADGDRLDLAITSVASTPTWVSICWTITKDD